MTKSWLSLILAGLFFLFPVYGFAASSSDSGMPLLSTQEDADGSLCVTGLTDLSYEGPLDIPAQIDGKSVTSIAPRAFLGSGVTEADIPAGIISIGDRAFEGCFALSHVNLPETITQMGESVFAGTLLEFCILPSKLEEIPAETFSGCPKLSAITLPHATQVVRDNAFRGCDSLQQIFYAGTAEEYSRLFVSETGNDPFIQAKVRTASQEPGGFLYNILGEETGDNLTVEIMGTADRGYTGPLIVPEIIDGYPVTAIGSHAFERMEGITSIVLPENVQNISSHAFRGCSALEAVSFSVGLQNIGNSAFQGCSALSSITLPDGVQSLGDQAFAACSQLTSAHLPDSVDSPGANLFAFSGLLTFDIPAGWKVIPPGTFLGCHDLASISIPGSLFAIDANAFSECGALEGVYVLGTQAQFDSIAVGAGNAPFTAAQVEICDFSLSQQQIPGVSLPVISGLTVSTAGTKSSAVLPVLRRQTAADAQIFAAGIGQAPIDAASPVGTGMTARWTNTSGQETSGIFLVKGDVTGSGIFNIVQLVAMARAMTGQTPLEGVYLDAGDWTGDGQLDIADLTREAAIFRQS